ncbi:hypothetical protein HW090_03345 [Pseudomonas sp. ABC1]|uniref:hypothetical protein n=1 Tax=Pseudomonas sp. ABC1 TaxID=2748080 RepID=UPI0015C2DD5E|nr:hypothetical protein [Pseudomonas sp. ABC1]QLF92287.1 hypothetical protein HW090_03345 [Pseudomonas sp. ABC1]
MSLIAAGDHSASSPIGNEHFLLLESLLAKLMSVGFDAAQKCELDMKEEGVGNTEAEQVAGWILRAFAIAKSELAELLAPDLLNDGADSLDPARRSDPGMLAKVLEADFEQSTVLFSISGPMTVSRRAYRIYEGGCDGH